VEKNMDKRLFEEWATVVEVVTRVVSAGSLAALALVAVMMWKGGGMSLAGSGTAAPSAGDAQAAVPPTEAVTQLTDDQWKEVTGNSVHIQGNKNAKVAVVEFTDYQCPFCGQFFTNTYGQIKKDYIDTNKISYSVQDLPLAFHPNAHISAEAAECAGDQKKYYEMHDKLFGSQADWSNEADAKPKFEGYAKDIGINVDQFKKCLADGKFKQQVDDDNALASKVGASGTPTFIINGKLLVGAQPYAEFQKAIDEALK
jgi:protein-disulfide isomerase